MSELKVSRYSWSKRGMVHWPESTKRGDYADYNACAEDHEKLEVELTAAREEAATLRARCEKLERAARIGVAYAKVFDDLRSSSIWFVWQQMKKKMEIDEDEMNTFEEDKAILDDAATALDEQKEAGK